MTPPPSDAAPYREATFYAEATRFLNGDTKGIVTAPELSRLMARIATQETATARARIAELSARLATCRALAVIGVELGGDKAHDVLPEIVESVDKALAPAAEPESR